MQLLNIMKNIVKDKIIELLMSEDREIRRLAESILLETYNLDFEIWKDVDWNEMTFIYHLHSPNDDRHTSIPYVCELHLIVLHGGYEKIEILRFINMIYEYNGEIR